MGFLRALVTGRPDALVTLAGEFESTGVNTPDAGLVDVDPALFGFAPVAENTLKYASPVERRLAVQVPAVKRCRDLIAGALATLPVDQYNPAGIRVDNALFEQPERDTARSVTMARTFEDLLFHGIAWWRVTERRWDNFPLHVRRLDPRSVNVHVSGKVYYARDGRPQGMAMEWVPDADLIRFDSPNDALLVAGARAIRTALHLAQAASADGVPPVTYFTPSEGIDPMDAQEDVKQFLKDWRDARREGRDAYVPAAVQLNTLGWNPDQLQLDAQNEHAVLDIARVAGVDPEELGVSTTSRTYANLYDRRKGFLDFTLGGYRAAMEDRLSMGDVTPQGHRARVRLDDFLRSAPKDRYEAYALGLKVGAITDEEIRALEDRPALTETTRPTPPAVEPPAPTEPPTEAPTEETA